MLYDKEKTELEIRVSRLRNANVSPQRFENHDRENSFSLSVNIYGPLASDRFVGNFLQKCEVYLQNPDYCGKDVPYLNPHCLTTVSGKTTMTSIFNELAGDEIDKRYCDDLDIFAELGNDEKFEKSLQSGIITTTLHKFAHMASMSLNSIIDLFTNIKSKH
jgi:hypothetical protein